MRKIIQNNIHGVDINEQAIEITQLNMFLKLATSSQQLIDLSKKIRVGNSLIDDPNVDPNAFDWNKEFPDKFDVLVGNPPYVRIQEITKKSKDLARYYKEKDYVSATKNFDLAVLFLEKGSRLLKEGGELGFIMTNKFLKGDYGVGVRKLICKKKILKELIDFGDQQVFSGISTYTCMIFLKNTESDSIKYSLIKKIESILEIIKIIKKEKEMESDKVSIRTINSKELNEQPWMFLNKTEQGIFQKTENMDRLGKISKIFVGLQTSADPVYIVSGKENGKNLEIKSNRLDKKFIVEKELFKPILTGKDAKKWVSVWSEKWILFPYVIGNDNVSIISEKVMSRKFPKTWDYLLKHKKILDKRENGTLRNKKNWHTYVYEKNHTLFHKRKILIGVLSKQSNFSSDEFGKYYFVGGGTAGVYGISLYDEKKYNSNYIIGLLNSSLLDWFVKKKSSKFNNGYFSYAKRFLEDLPICILENNHIIMKIEKIVKNIILNKNIVDNIQDSKKIFQINNNILNDEKEINQLVYELYQITDEEKAIIESSV